MAYDHSSYLSNSLNKPNLVYKNYVSRSGKLASNLTPYDLTVEPIPFEEANRFHLYRSIFGKVTFPYRNRQIPDNTPINLARQAFKLLLLMDAYRDSNYKLFDIEVVIFRSIHEGPAFTKFMKDLRIKMFVLLGFGNFLDRKQTESVERKEFSDIDCIVPYNYLINWVEPDDDDHLQSQIPVSITPENVEEYKRAVNNVLDGIDGRHDIKIVEEKDVLFNSASSIALVDQLSGDRELKWKIRQDKKKLSFSVDPLYGEISRIQVGPGNLRYGMILTNEQSNSVRILEKQIWEIVQHLPGSAMIRDPRTLRRRIRKFFDPFKYFLSRDLQKEGWTKPIELLNATLLVLSQRFPSFPCWKYIGIFDHITFFDSKTDKDYICLRGHGIGFANSLTTIYSLAIFFMALKDSEFTLVQDATALAWNDDFVARFDSSEGCEDYFEQEEIVMKKLSILRKDKACFYGQGFFHFLENYVSSNKTNIKFVHQRYLILQVLANANIIAAKIYFRSILSIVEDKIVQEYLDEIISFYGYELVNDELQYPSTFCGWFGSVVNDVDISLTRVKVDRLHMRLNRSYQIDPLSCLKLGKDKRAYTSPIEFLYPSLSSFADEFMREKFFFGKTLGFMEKKMTKYVKTNEEIRRAFSDCLTKRRELFKKDELRMELDFYRDYINSSPIDVIPPVELSELITIEGEEKYIDDSFLYESDDPIFEYLQSCSGNEKCSKYPLMYALTQKTSSEKETLKYIIANEDLWGDWTGVLKDGDPIVNPDYYRAVDRSKDLRDYYLKPNNVAKMLFSPGNFSIPVFKYGIRNALIEEKKKIFGRFLSYETIWNCKKMKLTRYGLLKVFEGGTDDVDSVLTEAYESLIVQQAALMHQADILEENRDDDEKVVHEEKKVPDEPFDKDAIDTFFSLGNIPDDFPHIDKIETLKKLRIEFLTQVRQEFLEEEKGFIEKIKAISDVYEFEEIQDENLQIPEVEEDDDEVEVFTHEEEDEEEELGSGDHLDEEITSDLD